MCVCESEAADLGVEGNMCSTLICEAVNMTITFSFKETDNCTQDFKGLRPL